MNPGRPRTRPPARQRGVSLVVALILLLVMTLLGLAALRGTVLQERMSANLLDRNRQFQAAEAGLRLAEARISGTGVSIPGTGCTDGVCATPVAGAADRWLDDGFGGWYTAIGTGSDDSAITTRYVIEYLGDGAYGPNCTTSKSTTETVDASCDMRRFRITARSEGSGRAAVILQSNYLAPK